MSTTDNNDDNEDDRPSGEQRTTGQDNNPASNIGCAVLVIIAVLILVGVVMLGRATRTRPTSDREFCERLMEENRDTAIRSPSNPYGVSEDTYVSNCMETQRNLGR